MAKAGVALAALVALWASGCDGGEQRGVDAGHVAPEAGSGGTHGVKDAGRGGRAGAFDATSVADARPSRDAGASRPSESRDATPAPDGAAVPSDGARPGEDAADGGVEDPGPALLSVPGWSVRKRTRANRDDVLLEETLVGFADPDPAPTRIRRLARPGSLERAFSMPGGSYISDFCPHPSGAFSAIVVETDRSFTLVRLSTDLTLLGTATIHDAEFVHDPHAFRFDGGPEDVIGNGLAQDPARIACTGEKVVATVDSTFNSVIAYRVSFTGGAWSAPERTLVEPPAVLTPFLPTGGSFDTFGAMTAWFRSMLDVDENGNAYVATWANPGRIRAHNSVFGDGLAALPHDPGAPFNTDADILVTKLDPNGARVWTRVVGTSHEDEPYALRARAGVVAVAGRARRFPGFDNTAWDAFASVLTTDGDVVGTRALTFDASSIFLAVDVLPGGGLFLGGSDGWSQNPEGLSIGGFGAKLLVELSALDAPERRLSLPPGPRHNEIRSVLVDPAYVFFGGHEDGPVMHTGDSDPTQIHATGITGFLPRRLQQDD